jgi:hypothetical protein
MAEAQNEPLTVSDSTDTRLVVNNSTTAKNTACTDKQLKHVQISMQLKE